MKQRKLKEVDEERTNIVKLKKGKNVGKFFGNLDNFGDYLIARFTDAITKGKETCEIAQIRDGDETAVSFVSADEYEMVIRDRIEKARERDDYDRAAKWKVLLEKLD